MNAMMKQLKLLLAFAMLALPAAVLACACCGRDDWRSVEPVPPKGYEAEILKRLVIGPGWLHIADMDESDLEISGAKRVNNSFVFASEAGSFSFSPTKPPEHRMVDVTFMTNPGNQLTDVAAIYHEVVFTGMLRLPAAAAKQLGRK